MSAVPLSKLGPRELGPQGSINIETTKLECCRCFGLHLLVFPHRGVSSNDFPGLETLCKKIMKEKQPFERLEIKKETLLEMFKVSEGSESNCDA